MKILFLITIFTSSLLFPQPDLLAQGKGQKRKPALKTGNSDINQWWIGVRGGTNFSNASVSQSYSVFTYNTGITTGNNEKKYESISLPGLQFGFSIGFEIFRGLSANLLPSYTSNRFAYTNSFSWQDTQDPAKRVTTDYRFETRLQYIEIPLTIKYELTSGRLKPYIQAGGYVGMLTDAIKKVETTGVDQASGANTEINVSKLSVGIEDRTQKYNYGVLGGAGFTYNIGNARIGLEVNYCYGLQNLDKGEMKFTDNQLLSGTYDVPDDYSLNNINISMQVIIPLKFITSKDYVPL